MSQTIPEHMRGLDPYVLTAVRSGVRVLRNMAARAKAKGQALMPAEDAVDKAARAGLQEASYDFGGEVIPTQSHYDAVGDELWPTALDLGFPFVVFESGFVDNGYREVGQGVPDLGAIDPNLKTEKKASGVTWALGLGAAVAVFFLVK